eukprot:CAMPEP_0185185930 /NCGR_PEP_ID=MMETSP1140-20130426/3671_1 /TAXON_ID=298111 /ORGANISM="Pavlova sp., Strain CCMP459" /LENGTH=100 /DNA_ID=CAMNT_0027752169 /DNA_START=9 /DNA_END=311 /DNA_ORIENTATION=-
MMEDIPWRKLTNRRKDEVRKEVYAHAFSQCRTEMEAMADCARGKFISIVWECRAENHVMNECLHQYTNKSCMAEAFDVAERKWNAELRDKKAAAAEGRAP